MTARNLIQFAYTSEWALAKFFAALFEDGVSDIFTLMTICGVSEKDKNSVLERLVRELGDRQKALKTGQDWRFTNILTEIRSITYLIDRLRKDKLNYFPLNRNENPINIPDGDYEAVVFTKNPTHIDYIETLLRADHNIVCEKPLVIVTNEFHIADRTQLDRLEDIVDKTNSNGTVHMDAEHYSAKRATITFYERIGEMIMQYGRISKIEAHTLEKDDPNKARTKNLLSIENRTGLLLDMGVHLFGIISNIGGKISETSKAAYDIYPGNPKTEDYRKCEAYDVETYVETEFKIKGSFFHNNANGNFTIAKFIDRFEGAERNPKDSKQFRVTFKSEEGGGETVVTLDFNEGTVTASDGRSWSPNPYLRISTNEYNNILRNLNRAIQNGEQPITNFQNSIRNLNTIHRCYNQFPVYNSFSKINKETQILKYKRKW
ncbi:MAG: hypothetical protein Q8N99_00400 [Nanoarchaeota archaeon]|nr:hypothetical protein [Nanoarchaeota archaeon]